MSAPVQQWHGPCSTFGGPMDHGVQSSEDLALYERGAIPRAPHGLFLPYQPTNTTGTARRLNPSAFYCACRWDYKLTGGVVPLREMWVLITSRHTDAHGVQKAIWAHPADWGPNERTGRVVDLSPGAAEALGVTTDESVTVELYQNMPSRTEAFRATPEEDLA